MHKRAFKENYDSLKRKINRSTIELNLMDKEQHGVNNRLTE